MGNGGGGNEKGKPGIADPGAAAADVEASVVDEVGWLVPDGSKQITQELHWWIHK